MAIKPISTIKNWFQTGLKPNQAQFWDTWDSFWHKQEKIPINAITDLENIINNKLGVTDLENHNTDSTAHKELFDTKVDKKEGFGLSQNDFTDLLKGKLENLEETDPGIQIIRILADDLQTVDKAGVMQWLDAQTNLQINFSKDLYIEVIDADRVYTNEFTREFY